MKKVSILMALLLVLIGCTPMTTNAESSNTQTSIEYYDNGDYAIIQLTTDTNENRNIINGHKTYEYNTSDGTQWSYTLYGSFYYNGTSAACTSVSDGYSINNGNWHINTHNCWLSGNAAYGTVTMDYKVLGVTINSVTRNLTLSCSANGTLS